MTVNLNKAGRAELMCIEGLGEEGAENIIHLREQHGAIQDLEELRDHGFTDFMIGRLRQSVILGTER